MTHKQGLAENIKFFNLLLGSMSEGQVWVRASGKKVYMKKGDKLICCNRSAYDDLCMITPVSYHSKFEVGEVIIPAESKGEVERLTFNSSNN